MSSDAMATPAPGRLIVHNEAAHRFETTQEGHLCVLDYALDGSVATYYHTGVPVAVEGRGIAADLTRVALETARARGWRVNPTCSYVAAYVQRHPEHQDLVV
ncbi:N-acetyltransferase domain-containing protein OS=Castellaniella defragrans OX=75697 GN=HNR28_001123 PE=4 SV=1 [Castellaniella defragrans]